jgi:hypothetical protein
MTETQYRTTSVGRRISNPNGEGIALFTVGCSCDSRRSRSSGSRRDTLINDYY